MKRALMFLSCVTFMSASSTPTVFGKPSSSSVAQQLMQIEQQLANAILKGDLTTYESILGPDWTTIDLTGHVLEKSEVVQQFASKDRQIDQAFIDDMKVKELGNVAVVTGRTTIYGSYKGQPVRIVLRFTDVFVKRKGRWQVVASQGTQVSS